MASKFAENTERLKQIAKEFQQKQQALLMEFIEDNAKTDEDMFYLTQALSMAGVSQHVQCFYQSMTFAQFTDNEIVPRLIDHLRKCVDAAQQEANIAAPQVLLPDQSLKL